MHHAQESWHNLSNSADSPEIRFLPCIIYIYVHILYRIIAKTPQVYIM